MINVLATLFVQFFYHSRLLIHLMWSLLNWLLKKKFYYIFKTFMKKIYTGPFHCANFVKIEEGWAKLMFSAFSNRAAFYLLKGTIFFTYSDSVLRLS